MSKATELAERAHAFEEQATKATDPLSKLHYREMAAHYRSLSVEHREVIRLQERRPTSSEWSGEAGALVPSFQNADKAAYRRIMATGLVLCITFVAISFSLRPQVASDRVLVKADRLVRTAGEPTKAR